MGVPVVKPPETYPWGRRSAWFRDPDGNIINFYMVTSAKKPSPAAQVRAYFQRLLNEKDQTVCDEMLASDYIDHDAPAGTPPGPQGVKAYVSGFLADYPDLFVEIEDLVEGKNRAAARITWRGTHRRTGVPLHQMGIILFHLNEQGQFIERWSAYIPPE
jgi:predicted ester cyclase